MPFVIIFDKGRFFGTKFGQQLNTTEFPFTPT